MQWSAEEIRDQWGIRGECLVNEPLAPLTTWQIGGIADLLIRPADIEDVHALFAFLRHYALPWLIIGGGSNVLIADAGVRGVVIQLSDVNTIAPCGDCQLRVGAGCRLNHLITEAVRLGYAGFEMLAGVPGTIGGAVRGNAGALGQQIGDCVYSALVAEDNAVERWEPADFAFTYRRSAITDHHFVLEVVLQCQRSQTEFLRQQVKLARQHRLQAQLVKGANAGSVFKNPPGHQAWKLIAQCGLPGESVGAAQISPHHANFIVNRGGATAGSVLELMALVQQRVAIQSGIYLEPEVHILGDFASVSERATVVRNWREANNG
jgi:UDP-N-acetylmuramate dehydrogenase